MVAGAAAAADVAVPALAGDAAAGAGVAGPALSFLAGGDEVDSGAAAFAPLLSGRSMSEHAAAALTLACSEKKTSRAPRNRLAGWMSPALAAT